MNKRVFKFRTWDLVNKRMLEYKEIMDLPMWEVFPGTPEQRPFEVMQYTGLKDKNKKEIYEGDILHVIKVNSDLVLDEYNAVVQWEDYGFVANSIGKVNNDTWLCAYDGNSECSQAEIEVIGNIYENQELLNEGRRESD